MREQLIIFLRNLRNEIITYILGKQGRGTVTPSELPQVLNGETIPGDAVLHMYSMKNAPSRFQNIVFDILESIKQKKVDSQGNGMDKAKVLVKQNDNVVSSEPLPFLKPVDDNVVSFPRQYIQNNQYNISSKNTTNGEKAA